MLWQMDLFVIQCSLAIARSLAPFGSDDKFVSMGTQGNSASGSTPERVMSSNPSPISSPRTGAESFL